MKHSKKREEGEVQVVEISMLENKGKIGQNELKCCAQKGP